jgi:hypothetical protein
MTTTPVTPTSQTPSLMIPAQGAPPGHVATPVAPKRHHAVVLTALALGAFSALGQLLSMGQIIALRDELAKMPSLPTMFDPTWMLVSSAVGLFVACAMTLGAAQVLRRAKGGARLLQLGALGYGAYVAIGTGIAMAKLVPLVVGMGSSFGGFGAKEIAIAAVALTLSLAWPLLKVGVALVAYRHGAKPEVRAYVSGGELV